MTVPELGMVMGGSIEVVPRWQSELLSGAGLRRGSWGVDTAGNARWGT